MGTRKEKTDSVSTAQVLSSTTSGAPEKSFCGSRDRREVNQPGSSINKETACHGKLITYCSYTCD